MRLVLDTSVIVSAFRSRNGASRRLMDLFDGEKFDLLIAPALLLEYEAVLTRPDQMSAHGFSPAEVETILATLASRAVRVKVYFQWRPQLPDPGDELVLEAGISGGADAIVTHNLHHFLPFAKAFGIEVFTPGRIIREGFRL